MLIYTNVLTARAWMKVTFVRLVMRRFVIIVDIITETYGIICFDVCLGTESLFALSSACRLWCGYTNVQFRRNEVITLTFLGFIAEYQESGSLFLILLSSRFAHTVADALSI